jgi:predicted ATP-grasp superfamily ATP-dependent carboligase
VRPRYGLCVNPFLAVDKDGDVVQGDKVRIFVFEYMTGGGCIDHELVPSLMEERDMLLSAVVRDLSEDGALDILISRDARLGTFQFPVNIHWVDRDWWIAWLTCLGRVDAVLPIAPDKGGMLETLCRSVEMAGKILLSSSAEAVAITSSKKITMDCLVPEGIPVIKTWRMDKIPPLDMSTLVIKPDQGIGCQNIHVITNKKALDEFIEMHSGEPEWVAQPYLSGQSISLSVLVVDGSVCLVGTNIQRVVQIDDEIYSLGCYVNGLKTHQVELLHLVQRICRAIPGLWGYVEVDLILTNEGPVVLAINPRLTMAYAGLSQSIGRNVASMILQLVRNSAALPQGVITGECVPIDLEMSHVA